MRTVRVFAALGAALGIHSATATAVTVRYYRFEEGAADIPAAGNGGILDETGARHGTPAGSPYYRADVPLPVIPQSGAPNALSLQFYGGQSIRFDEPFLFQSNTNATFEFFLKAPNQHPRSMLWTRGDSADCNRFNMEFWYGRLYIDYRAPGCPAHYVGGAGVGYPHDQWCHVAVTRTVNPNGTHTYRMYLDGQPQTEVVDTPDLPNDGVWTISGRGGEAFTGYLDEVRISDEALPPDRFLNAKPKSYWTDDFAAGLDASLWTIESNQPLYGVDATQGDVRFSKEVGGTYAFQYVAARFARQVEGDFEVLVDFRDARIDRVDGGPGNQVQLDALMDGFAFCIVRSDEVGAGHNAHVWLDPPGAWFGAVPAQATGGVMRIRREGSVVTGHLGETLLHSATCGPGPAQLYFILQNNGTRDATSVTFDDFRLAAARIVPVPPWLSSIRAGGAQLQLRVAELTPCIPYVLETAPRLAPATWSGVHAWTATGSSVLIELPLNTTAADAAFYRARTDE